MNLQILVSTLNSDPHKLVKKMHIDSDAIIINQCDKNSQEKFTYKKHSIYVFNTTERGIGKSRKMALALADADVVLFADDDEIMADNYTNKILQSFQNNKKTDFFIFEIGSKTNFKSRHSGRVHWWNSLKYGTTRFAVKRSSLLDSEITFDERFGAAEYGHGEDSIFLHDCLKAGLTIVKSNANIATFSENKSTWFNGYDKKYYQDTGALYSVLFGKKAMLLLIFNLVRHKTSIANIHIAIKGLQRYKKCS